MGEGVKEKRVVGHNQKPNSLEKFYLRPLFKLSDLLLNWLIFDGPTTKTHGVK